MTSRVQLLDFGGRCHALDGAAGAAGALADLLPELRAAEVRVLTDWEGAHFGVATMTAANLEAAAAKLEKQLREQGEIDDPAHMLVHQCTARRGMLELAYTAVPLKTWQRYQSLAAAAEQNVLWFDEVRVLLRWARQNDCQDGTLVLAARDWLDVMRLEQGRITALERVRCFHERSGNWREAAQRVVSLVQEWASRQADGAAPRPPLWLLQGPGSAAPLAELEALLAPLRVTQAWHAPQEPAELVELAQAAPSGEPARRLDWQLLIGAQPLLGALNSPLQKVAAWAARRAQAVGLAAFAASLLLAGAAGLTHYRVGAAAEARQTQSGQAQALWRELDASVKQADQLGALQKDQAGWWRQRLGNAALPGFFTLLTQLRECLPPGMMIEEVGLVAEKGEHLITVVGQAGTLEGSLRDEASFVAALRNQGFVVVKRDMVVGAGQQKFKLSMTWSAA